MQGGDVKEIAEIQTLIQSLSKNALPYTLEDPKRDSAAISYWVSYPSMVAKLLRLEKKILKNYNMERKWDEH